MLGGGKAAVIKENNSSIDFLMSYGTTNVSFIPFFSFLLLRLTHSSQSKDAAYSWTEETELSDRVDVKADQALEKDGRGKPKDVFVNLQESEGKSRTFEVESVGLVGPGQQGGVHESPSVASPVPNAGGDCNPCITSFVTVTGV